MRRKLSLAFTLFSFLALPPLFAQESDPLATYLVNGAFVDKKPKADAAFPTPFIATPLERGLVALHSQDHKDEKTGAKSVIWTIPYLRFDPGAVDFDEEGRPITTQAWVPDAKYFEIRLMPDSADKKSMIRFYESTTSTGGMIYTTAQAARYPDLPNMLVFHFYLADDFEAVAEPIEGKTNQDGDPATRLRVLKNNRATLQVIIEESTQKLVGVRLQVSALKDAVKMRSLEDLAASADPQAATLLDYWRDVTKKFADKKKGA